MRATGFEPVRRRHIVALLQNINIFCRCTHSKWATPFDRSGKHAVELLPGLEPGLQDSKSCVMTITL